MHNVQNVHQDIRIKTLGFREFNDEILRFWSPFSAECSPGNIFHLVGIFTCHCRVILMGSDHFLSGKQIGNLNPF